MADPVPEGFTPDAGSVLPEGFTPDASAPKQTAYTGLGGTLAAGIKSGDPLGYVVGQAAEGAARGAVSTARNVAGLLPQSWQDQLSGLRQRLGLPSMQTLRTPTNAAQSVGKGAEQVAEFLAPQLAVEKVLPAANLAIRMGALGAGNAAVAKAQGSGHVGTALAAVTGAAGPVLGTAAPAVANKIENVALKAGARDYAAGYNPANVFKYGVGGSVAGTLERTTKALQDTYSQLKSVLGQSTTGVDFNDAIDQAESLLKSQSARNVGQNQGIQRALDFWRKEATFLPQAVNLPQGQIDLLTANQVKQGVGDLGAWLHNPGGKSMADPDALAGETVANTLYDVLKKRIEAAAPQAGEVAALNKKLGDLIPIRGAALRRIPVESRREVLHLGDLMGLMSGHVPVSVAARLLNSGHVANLLANGPISGAVQTLGGAAASAADQPQGPQTP